MLTEQLVLDIPGWPDLDVTPTAAMRAGTQRVFQCSWCGCVVVVPSGHDLVAPCPVGHDEPTSWWQQQLPVAGISVSA